MTHVHECTRVYAHTYIHTHTYTQQRDRRRERELATTGIKKMMTKQGGSSEAAEQMSFKGSFDRRSRMRMAEYLRNETKGSWYWL